VLERERTYKRTFQTRGQRPFALGLAAIGAAFFIILTIHESADAPIAVVAIVAAIAIYAIYPTVRLAFAAIKTTESGVRISNIWRNVDLSWNDIERFDMGPFGIYPSVARVHTLDGRVLKAVGIAERTYFPDGSAERMVEELNQELKRQRTGVR
jgi:hypothetical protein